MLTPCTIPLNIVKKLMNRTVLISAMRLNIKAQLDQRTGLLMLKSSKKSKTTEKMQNDQPITLHIFIKIPRIPNITDRSLHAFEMSVKLAHFGLSTNHGGIVNNQSVKTSIRFPSSKTFPVSYPK